MTQAEAEEAYQHQVSLRGTLNQSLEKQREEFIALLNVARAKEDEPGF